MGCRGAPCSVIADSIARQAAVAVNRRGRRGAFGEAGMGIENIDNPPQGFVGEDDLGAVELPQIVRCVAFKAPPF